MPLAKLTCPKCHATLRPAKPVPEGKTVKCPKCEESFKAGGEAAPEEKAAARSKPAAAAATGDDEDGGTYAVLKDEAEEKKKSEEERRKRKKKRSATDDEDEEPDDDEEGEDGEKGNDLASELLRSLKQRDPRGPAQETIVSPGNWLLRTALIGFFGWVIYFMIFMIPVAFQVKDEGDDKPKEEEKKVSAPVGKGGDKTKSQEEIEKEKEVKKAEKYRHWWSAETILHEDRRAWAVPLFVFVLLLGLAQAAVIANASVKMQSLESYQWSVVGCVTTMVPLITFPVFVFVTFLIGLLDYLLDAGWDEISWMIALAAFLWGPVVGGLCLKQVLQPHVKKGFEYKPE